VLLLQPTSPLRTAEDVSGLLEMVAAQGAMSAVSVCETRVHPQWMYRMGPKGTLDPLLPSTQQARRQDLPPVYSLNGSLYYAVVEWLAAGRNFVGPETLGYVMPAARSVDIDDEFDWAVAAKLFEERSE
jgi:N-acylneuraminate cytidylyltransferase